MGHVGPPLLLFPPLHLPCIELQGGKVECQTLQTQVLKHSAPSLEVLSAIIQPSPGGKVALNLSQGFFSCMLSLLSHS